MRVIDPERLKAARGRVKKHLSQTLRAEFEAVYDMAAAQVRAGSCPSPARPAASCRALLTRRPPPAVSPRPQGPYQFTPQEVGRRRLRNTALDYLSADKDGAAARRAKAQVRPCSPYLATI